MEKKSKSTIKRKIVIYKDALRLAKERNNKDDIDLLNKKLKE